MSRSPGLGCGRRKRSHSLENVKEMWPHKPKSFHTSPRINTVTGTDLVTGPAASARLPHQPPGLGDGASRRTARRSLNRSRSRGGPAPSTDAEDPMGGPRLSPKTEGTGGPVPAAPSPVWDSALTVRGRKGVTSSRESANPGLSPETHRREKSRLHKP